MSRIGFLFLAIILMTPTLCVKADNVEFEIGLVHYTNKTPFQLIGKAVTNAEITMRGKSVAKIGEDGIFKIDLEVKEGSNIFHFKATKNGQSTTKGILVEMRTTPPKVHLYIDKVINSEPAVKTECLDMSEYVLSGFTVPGSVIEADGLKVVQDGIMFSAMLSLEKAPSWTDHVIKVTDRYGNTTTSAITVTNIHAKVCRMQIGNKKATIDGEEFDMPIEPIIHKGSIVVPVRFFSFNFLGGTVDFNFVTKTVTIRVGKDTLTAQVDNPKATFNGNKITINGAPPMIINGSLMVPPRFIGELFGCTVAYDQNTKTVTTMMNVRP